MNKLLIGIVKDLDETTGKVDEAKKLNIHINAIDEFTPL